MTDRPKPWSRLHDGPRPPRTGWYVYALVDPRDGRPFYIGKGCRGRVYQHVREAFGNAPNNHRKIKKIASIVTAGLRIGHIILSEHAVEADAFDAEHDMLKSLRHTGLTNILLPGEKARNLREIAIAEAQAMWDRVTPFDTWLKQRPRSRRDCEVYGFVVAGLANVITSGGKSKVIHV